ncbi:MAG: DUF86 domain-containing protein [Chloroflexi bacterium]|nr:MAG: DUF86 domain-containing protein [Chloroflexota bacterium]
MRDDRERLLDMLEAIHKIEQYAHDELFSSRGDELVEVWMIHHLQIIGEAASRVTQELQKKHPEVAWGGMIGMRHVLVHGYFETDTELVQKAVERDLPILKTQLENILAGLK